MDKGLVERDAEDDVAFGVHFNGNICGVCVLQDAPDGLVELADPVPPVREIQHFVPGDELPVSPVQWTVEPSPLAMLLRPEEVELVDVVAEVHQGRVVAPDPEPPQLELQRAAPDPQGLAALTVYPAGSEPVAGGAGFI